MAISGCTNGLVVTALVTLLLLPVQYYVPELWTKEPTPIPRPLPRPISENVAETWFFLDFPPLDLFLTVSLLFLAMITYLCDWIQRKLMERRLLKVSGEVATFGVPEWITEANLWFFIQACLGFRWVLLNQYLCECVERLRGWDARQEQLEATLRMVQNATSEYNLLLYLLLRHHRLGPPARKPPSHCFFDKELDDLNFITNPVQDFEQNAL